MKLKLYMKSGNVVVIDHVDDWEIKYNNDSITSLDITWAKGKKGGKGVVIGSLNLSQIEAMERV